MQTTFKVLLQDLSSPPEPFFFLESATKKLSLSLLFLKFALQKQALHKHALQAPPPCQGPRTQRAKSQLLSSRRSQPKGSARGKNNQGSASGGLSEEEMLHLSLVLGVRKCQPGKEEEEDRGRGFSRKTEPTLKSSRQMLITGLGSRTVSGCGWSVEACAGTWRGEGRLGKVGAKALVHQAVLFEFHPEHRSLKDFQQRSDRARCALEGRGHRWTQWGWVTRERAWKEPAPAPWQTSRGAVLRA